MSTPSTRSTSSIPPSPGQCRSVKARVRQCSLSAGFALAAILPPLFCHGTEAGNAAWAWFLFFALQSVLVLADPSIFLS